jgi:hypothetical protein
MSMPLAAVPETRKTREPILDTIDRVSEMCFGLFMALTFVGMVSATQDPGVADPARAMLYAALGCNLAWGLVDAVMYLVRTLTSRGKRMTLAITVRDSSPSDAALALRKEMPAGLRALVSDKEIEAIRTRLATAQIPDRPRLSGDDFIGALGIFLIVVLTTFPVALPFVLLDDMKVALLISRVLTIAMLFGAGLALGRYSGYGGLKAAFAMTILGVALTAAIIALGG